MGVVVAMLALMGPGDRLYRQASAFEVVSAERDVLYIRCREPMEGISLHRLAERYDYYVEWSADRRSARVLLYTASPMLTVQVDTSQDKDGWLKRRQSVTVVNPLRTNRRN